MLVFYIISIIIIFLGIVINLPGTLHINPILAHFYDAHDALFLATVFLVMGSVSRIIIFKNEIIKEKLLMMCLLGFFGGISAGFFVGKINEKILIIIFLISGLKFLFDYIKNKSKQIVKKNKSKSDIFIASYVTAFLQTFGVSVGSIRQGYYFSQGYTLQNVQGTVAVIFLFSGVGTIFSRVFSENISYLKILDILPIFPIMLITMYAGKKVLYKIPKSWQDNIILYSLILSLLSVIPLILK